MRYYSARESCMFITTSGTFPPSGREFNRISLRQILLSIATTGLSINDESVQLLCQPTHESQNQACLEKMSDEGSVKLMTLFRCRNLK